MTYDEVKRWADHHDTRFPGFLRWLAKQANPDGMVQFWAEQLRHVGVLDAQLASDRMFESEHEPPGFGNHVREIKYQARKIELERGKARKFAAFGEATKDCPYCGPTGVVMIVAPADLRRIGKANHDYYAKVGIEPPDTPRPAVVGCRCARGDRWVEGHDVIRFTPGVHVTWAEHLTLRGERLRGIERPPPAAPAGTQLSLTGEPVGEHRFHPRQRLPQAAPEPVAASSNSGEGMPF